MEQIREFVIAGHGNLERVTQMLAENPKLLNASYSWNENDSETAVQAAAQVGSVAVAQFLLKQGAPLEICTAAMLGMQVEVARRLNNDPGNANARGAHGIPLLPHTVWSENPRLVQLVFEKGAKSGATLALQNAVSRGNFEIVQWMVGNAGPDIKAKNFQGKTPLAVATERKNDRIITFLKQHGAAD
ncbi:MAG TPA: ankyrin repeat domain-containing protein [Candidatus Angelobacter sp.]|nr:ankyrin repeat domain-containing protein [Candidatus Angelobacter sp.]